EVAALAASLKARGVTAGDRVAAMMPNCIETIVGMLATTSLGAIWSSCSPDFGVQGVVDRFGQIEPKVFITVDGYFYNGKSLDISNKVAEIRQQLPTVEHTVIVNFAGIPANFDATSTSWEQFLDRQTTTLEFVRMPFNAPLYIMFSSGTTGVPKCIVHGI